MPLTVPSGSFGSSSVASATNSATPATPTITEPEAAAIHYASVRRLDDGESLAVYDLGGGTFDITVLRKLPQGIEILGVPEGIEPSAASILTKLS